ncbi:Maintenance of mitochondrial morphology protein 1 [Golovinomyces cichoracearum]|uniref:Maintenance of mitochondrial morphology protein 1 n=1 Tax=Golovinomyces cichoracearum TaxID=62708 RepID=A0A420IN80_9PEZI|nr:Maintenance of mitochondrial morphology protein 1 [Golovinomyces cichoracearum]
MADNSPFHPDASSSLSFIQGLLFGQLSIVILIGVFIKFFIFGDPPSADITASLRATKRRSYTHARNHSLLSVFSSTSRKPPPALRKKQSSVLRNPPPLSTNTILSKTYYNVESHQPESLDWFNVLIAQTIAKLRADAQCDDAILTSLTIALNGNSRPDYIGEIKVTELSLGDEFPIFSNCRVIPVDEDGLSIENQQDRSSKGGGSKEFSRLQARMDVDLSDSITLAVETKLLLNYPKPLVAVLPVALAVSVVRFSGTLSISFIPGSPQTATLLTFSFLNDYRLDLSIRSLVGSKSRLQDMPKIAQIVEKRLHTWFDERAVEPIFQQIELPSLWPRKKNTRRGEEESLNLTTASDGKCTSRTERGEKEVPHTPRKTNETFKKIVDSERCIRNQDRTLVTESQDFRWRGPAVDKFTMADNMPRTNIN